MPRALLLLAIALPALASEGDGPLPPLAVNTRALPDKTKLGEPFTVEVMITHVKDQRYDLKPPDDGAFDVADVQRKRVDGPDSATTTFTVTMAAFELGKKKTPQLQFEVAAGEKTGTFSTPGVDVEILSTIPAEAEKTGAGLFDIRPPVDVSIRTWRLLWALAVALAVGLAAYALMRWLKRPKVIAAAEVKPAAPLEVRVRAALDALRTEDLPGKGRVREYYFRLSEILRAYLGERYGFDALESTTPELMDSLRRLHTPGLAIKELNEFTNESDFVRYARATVGSDTCKLAMELAYSVVQATTPTAAHVQQPRVP